ncbi:RMD1 family protein [Cognatitamlana onchidii]|uniref:RMD1 family protein n=1 Tax=Cognatitamlana onchidii TaxID=2562860 RepID=UPI0010A5E0B3|nr:RMD1 family protein [Algibacter onchidii]
MNLNKSNAVAFKVSENIDIGSLRTIFKQSPLFYDNDELFYSLEEEKYFYVFKYGIICFFNCSSMEINTLKRKIAFALKGTIIKKPVSESVDVILNSNETSIDFDNIKLRDNNSEKIRLIMLNLSQSVALNFYYNISEQILEDTRRHTNILEEKGKLNISGKKLKRYIGSVLNVKNKISENLYIFESHEVASDDKVLKRLNAELKKKFDLIDRHHIIHHQIDIVKENLDLFKDIMFHRESSRLELIIIILIVIEVIDLFILKFN